MSINGLNSNFSMNALARANQAQGVNSVSPTAVNATANTANASSAAMDSGMAASNPMEAISQLFSMLATLLTQLLGGGQAADAQSAQAADKGPAPSPAAAADQGNVAQDASAADQSGDSSQIMEMLQDLLSRLNDGEEADAAADKETDQAAADQGHNNYEADQANDTERPRNHGKAEDKGKAGDKGDCKAEDKGHNHDKGDVKPHHGGGKAHDKAPTPAPAPTPSYEAPAPAPAADKTPTPAPAPSYEAPAPAPAADKTPTPAPAPAYQAPAPAPSVSNDSVANNGGSVSNTNNSAGDDVNNNTTTIHDSGNTYNITINVMKGKAQDKGPHKAEDKGHRPPQDKGDYKGPNKAEDKSKPGYTDHKPAGGGNIVSNNTNVAKDGDIASNNTNIAGKGDIASNNTNIAGKGDIASNNTNIAGKGDIASNNTNVAKDGDIASNNTNVTGKGDIASDNTNVTGKGDIASNNTNVAKDGDIASNNTNMTDKGNITSNNTNVTGNAADYPPTKPPAYDDGDKGKYWGDPHFVGFGGEKYDVMGEVGKTYNVLSDKGVQYNTTFEAWGKPGADGVQPTIIGAAGIQVGDHKVEFDRSGKAPTVNGKALAKDEKADLGNSRYASWDGKQLEVNTGEYTIDLSVKDKDNNGGYIDSNVKVNEGVNPLADGIAAHGLLGQTADGVKGERKGKDNTGDAKQGGTVIDGTYKDYEVKDLFDTSFKKNNKFNG